MDQLWNLVEAGIASKKFVSAEPGERDLQTRFLGCVAHPVRVDAVRGGLIHGPEQVIEPVFEIAPGHSNRLMIGAVESRDFFRKRSFVVRRALVLVKT